MLLQLLQLGWVEGDWVADDAVRRGCQWREVCIVEAPVGWELGGVNVAHSHLERHRSESTQIMTTD